MSAFVIVDIEITDPALYEEYKRLAAPTVSAHGGRYVVRGGRVEILEGSWMPGRFVILEFPDTQTARDWWDSEDYRPARKIRQACAETGMILVEGI